MNPEKIPYLVDSMNEKAFEFSSEQLPHYMTLVDRISSLKNIPNKKNDAINVQAVLDQEMRQSINKSRRFGDQHYMYADVVDKIMDKIPLDKNIIQGEGVAKWKSEAVDKAKETFYEKAVTELKNNSSSLTSKDFFAHLDAINSIASHQGDDPFVMIDNKIKKLTIELNDEGDSLSGDQKETLESLRGAYSHSRFVYEGCHNNAKSEVAINKKNDNNQGPTMGLD